MIATINPATGETLREFPPLSADAIEKKLRLSWTTFQSFRHTPFADRARCLQKAAEILEAGKRDYGTLMTTEMGKTLASAIAEAEKCAWACRYYAENGEKLLADEPVSTNASRSLVRYQPLGPVLAVMPWNFPFWQVFRFAAPALAAGNTGLLKHASNVPQCALAIEDILRRAGFREGAFQTLLIEANQVDALLHDDRIVAATLTGSEPAGRSVARASGSQIKKTVLELGGSDPFIVMPSADFEAAVSNAVKARVINNGQSCIAAKRFIVGGEIYDAFEKSFVDRMKALKVGDPMAADTDVGPLATSKIRDELHDQVQRAVAAGGRLLAGGQKIGGPGFYYEPTVLTGVPRTSPIFREEFFGPVAMLFRARDVGEAIELANDSPFGLGSSVWTRDASEQARFEEAIEAGQVFVNAMVASDPRLPFGGVKRSGYGRELGVWGIREFVNVKTIWCNRSSTLTTRLICTFAALASLANAGTLFLPAYPNALLVFDEGQGQIVDRIPLTTGTPRSMKLSQDRKTIYVTTIDHNGLEVVDIATRKVTNHFVLNTSTKQFRFRGGAPGPDGKLFYTVTKEIDKFPDHYDVHDSKYTVIDLAEQKIVKTVDIPREDLSANEAGFGRTPFEVSPDGKFLYQFGAKISVFRADDFKLIDRIDLAQPEFPGMERIRFGSDLDLIGQPGQHISIFNSADPVVHNKVFGIGRFNLETRQMDFDPIGPAPSGMAGVQVTPDKKFAYTVVTNGALGNKRCEFWAFDLTSDRIAQTAEVPCRARFTFGMASSGKKLYIYGAGFEIEVYDAATLRYERTWDLKTDVTPAGIVVLP